MDAHRDGLAHRFIANVLAETTSWPASLQLGLYQLAFATLPEIILELDAADARKWARDWRRHMDAEIAAPVELSSEAVAWVEDLAREWVASHPMAAPEAEASPVEISRLADLFERFGPLALGLPWRTEPPAKA